MQVLSVSPCTHFLILWKTLYTEAQILQVLSFFFSPSCMWLSSSLWKLLLFREKNLVIISSSAL